MTPVVIDIYQGNDITDMVALKNAGIIGIIHKATQGVSVVDKRYNARRAWAKKEGPELWGAYHFNSETSSITDQAKEFVDHAAPDEFTLLGMDWEGDVGQAFSVREARTFLDTVMQLTKRTPSGLWIYGGNIPRERITSAADMAYFGQFHNWHCQYGHEPVVSKAWKNGYELWQYSETGQLPGTGGKVDLNVYNGDIAKLRATWAPGYAKLVVPASGPSVPAVPPAKPIVISEPINKTPTKPVDQRPPAPTEPSLGQKLWDWWKSH